MKPLSKIVWIFLFAVAMGYLESAVVVYLRAIYYPDGFTFPLKVMSQTLAITEMYREAATLVMLIAIGIMSSKHRLHRFAWFLIVFAIWDIAYYVFLKALLNWPDSFLTTDILFLLPCIWTGPVIAPVINSLNMILLAVSILHTRKGNRPTFHLSGKIWALLIVGCLLILVAYTKDFAGFALDKLNTHPLQGMSRDTYIGILTSEFMPRSFSWFIFSAGVSMHLVAVYLVF
ncbi:MAG: hypothetical protein WCI48_16815, partial [Bacteroidota bacterium]